jgi:hypothetical protein
MRVSLIDRLMTGLVALALSCTAGAGAANAGAGSRTEPMSFGECLALVEEVSEELGVTPVNILRTKDVWVMRVDAVDGAIVITCNRPDSRLTLTRRTSM